MPERCLSLWRLIALEAWQLGYGARLQLEAHLADCPGCRAYAAALEGCARPPSGKALWLAGAAYWEAGGPGSGTTEAGEAVALSLPEAPERVPWARFGALVLVVLLATASLAAGRWSAALGQRAAYQALAVRSLSARPQAVAAGAVMPGDAWARSERLGTLRVRAVLTSQEATSRHAQLSFGAISGGRPRSVASLRIG